MKHVIPVRVVALIERAEGAWSDHAAEERFRLGLEWIDVILIARTANWRNPPGMTRE